MPNETHSYLLANTPLSTMGFSAKTGTTSVYLNGPGGEAGDGFALPRRGYLTGITLWDGSLLRTDIDKIAFDSGDRLSVYCQSSGLDFTVKVRLNGASTTLQIPGVAFNATLKAVIEFMLVRE